MSKAIYPGTFDPLTGGHEDIVRRAARIFPAVVVAVARSQAKQPIFDNDERVAIARDVLADCPNVSVVSFSGLLVELAREQGANVILRGVRSVTDFDYEFQMAGMNRLMNAEVETILMAPSEGHQYVSGTLVREIARMGGDVGRFVHPIVVERLRGKLAN